MALSKEIEETTDELAFLVKGARRSKRLIMSRAESYTRFSRRQTFIDGRNWGSASTNA